VSGLAVQARYTAHTARHTKPGPVALADYLAGYQARGQHAHPRLSVIAKRFGRSIRTIQRWIAELEEAGLLVVKRHLPHHDHITGRWKRRPNGYTTRFKKSKRGRAPEKDLVTPRRHLCHDIGLSEEPSKGSAPESVAIPPWEAAGMTAAQWTRHQILQGRTDE
jgi:hypothetical protein